MREPDNIAMFGFTGVGKTKFAMDCIEGQSAICLSNAPRDRSFIDIPLIASDKVGTVVGDGKIYKVHEPFNLLKAIENISNLYYNGNVLYDDLRSVLKGNLAGSVETMIGQVRHNGSDQFFSFWNLNHIPPFLCDMTSKVVLFKTGETDMRGLPKLPRMDEVMKAYEWVQGLDPVVYKRSYAYLVTNPLDPKSKLPFVKVLRKENPATQQ